MDREKIDVAAYAGRQGDERPLAFTLRGVRIDVKTVIDSWIEERAPDRTRRRCFRVEDSDGNRHVICCDETSKEWHRLS